MGVPLEAWIFWLRLFFVLEADDHLSLDIYYWSLVFLSPQSTVDHGLWTIDYLHFLNDQ